MPAGTLAAAALAATAVILPASPEAVAVGDIDGDATNELVVLLVWPEWGSASIARSTDPTMYEVDVVPALRDRRELRAYEIAGGVPVPAAPPLPVGREVLMIGPERPVRAPFAVTDEGLAALVIETAPGGERALRVAPRTAIAHALRGAERPVGGRSFLRAAQLVLPTADGFALIDPEGRVQQVPASFRKADSGFAGALEIRMPRLLDVDRDGRLDLLEVAPPEAAVVLRRGGEKGFGPPERWDITALPGTGAGAGVTCDFVDALDADADGTLDAVLLTKQTEFDSLRSGMKGIRGVDGAYAVHRLVAGGAIEGEPHARFTAAGHGLTIDHPDGWDTAFRDLDGDGPAELLTMTVRFGWFGAARALATKTAKAGVEPRVFRRAGRTWREVADAAPPFDVAIDLANSDLSRFFRVPGDVDADGMADLVQFDGRDVRVHPGRSGGRFAPKPGLTLRLEDRVRDVFGAVFTDLDGDLRLELIAFEELAADGDNPARPVRMELRRLDGPR